MYGIFPYIWVVFMVNVDIYTIHGSYGKGKSLVKFDIIHVSLVPFFSDLCPTGQPVHRALKVPASCHTKTSSEQRHTRHLGGILTTHDRHPWDLHNRRSDCMTWWKILKRLMQFCWLRRRLRDTLRLEKNRSDPQRQEQ